MKNLKKALVLVLAFAMVFGMFTINASAASFADDEDIVNTEAVSTMSQLGVINGYEDGTFLPDQIVTRAEMCKMICVALNGGKAPLLGSTAAVFSDTAGHWANDYINYCYSAGIVSGDAGKGGIFRPDATVTGIEAAKMMLVALGYNPAVAGYTGAEWANNVAMDANKKDLFEGIGSVNASAGLIRDNAAQLIFNGIGATMVEYSNFLDTVNGQLVSKPTVKDVFPAKSILSTMFKVVTNYGQLTSVSKGSLSIDEDDNYEAKATGDAEDFTKVASDYSNLLGQTVKVMYKSTSEVLGVTALDVNSVATANISAITANGAKVKFGGTSYALDNGTTNKVTLIKIATDGAETPDANATVDTFTGNADSYDTVKFIDNDGDGKYEYAIQTVIDTAKVTYASSTEIVAGSSYKYADNNIADDIAKNDYVAISYDVFNAKRNIVKVEKATAAVAVSGDKSKYLFDGTWYNKGTGTLDSTAAGKVYDYYTLNGVIVALKLSSENASSNTANLVMFLADSGEAPLSKNVKILNMDGTKEIVTVSDDSTLKYSDLYTSGGTNHGKVYSIARTDKGVKFSNPDPTIGSYKKITTLTFGDPIGTVSSGDPAGDTDEVNSIPVADTAKIFIYNDTAKDGQVITGKQLKSTFKYRTAAESNTEVDNALITAYSSTVNGLNRTSIAAVTVGGATLPSVSIGDTNYALVVSAAYQLDDTYAKYTIWNGTSTQEVRQELTNVDEDTLPQFAVITYGSIDSGIIKDVTKLDPQTSGAAGTLIVAPVKSVETDKMWVTDSTSFKLNSKTVYMYYDSSTKTAGSIGIAGGELVRADKVVGVDVPNVQYVADTTDVKFVLVDIKNTVKDDIARTAFTANTAANVASVAADSSTTFAVTYTKATNVLPGEIITMKVTTSDTTVITNGLELTGAKFVSNETDTIANAHDAGTAVTYTFSIVCTNEGAISVAVS